ncbi:hypothetical protein LG288_07650 [Idiomarina seosinensis]|uniref:hypothetical protein n=1 Tax=Idiomarina seosinensis TaxID=281739 RepID=UPI00384D7ACE
MIYTIIISLIILLVILAVAIGAVQQHKQRQDLARRQKLAKYRAALEQVEDLLNMVGYFPIGRSLVAILNARAKELLQGMYDVSPTDDFKARVNDYEERLKNLDVNDTSLLNEEFELPRNDKQIIAMINALKRMRSVLRSEHARGKVDSRVYTTEDARLQQLQLKISVETLIRRGENAYQGHMLGSARQYYEKAKRSLDDQSYTDDYIEHRKKQVEQALEQITDELKDVNNRDVDDRKHDEIEELFQPKKKW